MSREKWKPIRGFAGLYWISDQGRVWSNVKDRYLKPGKTSVGYPSVCLGRGNTRLVHRLVAAAFIGTIRKGTEVLHRDGSRDNSKATNLRIDTRSKNTQDVVNHGRRKLTTAEIARVRKETKNAVRGTGVRLANQLGVCQSMISGIKHRVQYKYLP